MNTAKWCIQFSFIISTIVIFTASSPAYASDKKATKQDLQFIKDTLSTLKRGRDTFRHETLGNESFWTDSLRLNEAISGSDLGGVGPGLSPETALAIGLKVDVNALPRSLQRALRKGQVDLTSPETTLALLKLNAVVGVIGSVNDDGELESVGITCALCHSVVDDSFAPGIGQRLDGWANRDIDPGLIISLAPDLSAFADILSVDQDTVRTVLQSWGPGRFDGSLIFDGQAFTPDGKTAATLIPPAFGLAGVNLHTWTGWGGVAHWNALVANLELGGQGTFFDPRLDDVVRFPIAAANGFSDVRPEVDLVTPKLADLNVYQLALKAPEAPRGSFNPRKAARGKVLFSGQADCARCHVPPLFTEPGWNLHTPEEIGIDSFQADRGPEGRYRTAPLKGLWTHAKGGFFHDGRFATLLDVVEHYDTTFSLGLNNRQKQNLVEYLKSL